MLLAPQSHPEVTSLPSFLKLHFSLYSVLSYHQLFCLAHFLNFVTSILTMPLVFMIFFLFPRLLNQQFWTVCQDYYNSFLISVLTSNLLIFQSTIHITITLPLKKKDCSWQFPLLNAYTAFYYTENGIQTTQPGI